MHVTCKMWNCLERVEMCVIDGWSGRKGREGGGDEYHFVPSAIKQIYTMESNRKQEKP